MQIRIVATALATLMTLTTMAHAKPGDLDSSFGSKGIVVTDIGNNQDMAESIAIQNDGKILAAGCSKNSSNNDVFTIVRYRTNGLLDSSFGTDGRVTTTTGNSGGDCANSIFIQNDGKIVAAGGLTIVRYNENGALDGSFGNGGKVSTGTVDIYDAVIQNDGKIVAAGNAYNGSDLDFAVVRYNSDGTVDSTFGNGGKVITPIGSSYDRIVGVAIQSDGKIVVAGNSDYGDLSGNKYFALVRYTNNGVLDNTFGNNGKVLTAVGGNYDSASSLSIQKDGKIIVAGNSDGNGKEDFAVVRYTNNGVLDNTFGNNGKVLTAVGIGGDYAADIAIQNNGKIVVVGTSFSFEASDMVVAIVRYDSNGTPDNLFGNNGKVTTNISSGGDEATNVAIQNDGKIVIVGFSNNSSSNSAFAIARYLGDSTPIPAPVPTPIPTAISLAPIYKLLLQ
ncbi:MAG TPA: hypothetical protein ENI88_11625 [Desulfobulbus sp.]|nr:hypothetical protein [Desulfobulbus sp.]